MSKKKSKNPKFRRGDIVVTYFSGEPLCSTQKYLVAAVSPDNHLFPDRVDICEIDRVNDFKNKRGVGMPIKYLKKIGEFVDK